MYAKTEVSWDALRSCSEKEPLTSGHAAKVGMVLLAKGGSLPLHIPLFCSVLGRCQFDCHGVFLRCQRFG